MLGPINIEINGLWRSPARVPLPSSWRVQFPHQTRARSNSGSSLESLSGQTLAGSTGRALAKILSSPILRYARIAGHKAFRRWRDRMGITTLKADAAGVATGKGAKLCWRAHYLKRRGMLG